MSGKKQKAVPGWFECSKCKKRISRQLATKHSGDEESGCRRVYPYLKKNELFCVLNNVTSTTRKIGELPFIKDKRLSSSTIFISEELIKECDLTTFGWISLTPLVCSEDVFEVSRGDTPNVSLSICDTPASNYAFRVWPVPESIGSNQNNLLTVLTMDGFGVNKLAASNAKLDGSGDSPIGLVSIQKLSSSVRPIQEIFIAAIDITIVIENFDELDPVSFEIDRFVKSFRKIIQGRPIALNNRFKIRFYAQFVHVLVTKIVKDKTDDDGAFGLSNLNLKDGALRSTFSQVVSTTEINVITGNNDASGTTDKRLAISVALKDVGGIPSLLKEICATAHFILNTALDVPKGILLYGHTGVGKSLILQAIQYEFKLFGVLYEEFKSINLDSGYDNSRSCSSSLEKVFKDAVARAPSVIIVEGLDVVAGKKNSDSGTAPMTQFCADFSRLVSTQKLKKSKVLILCTATDVDRIDPNMRTPKIFAKEIEIPVPSALAREDILNKILRHFNHSLTTEEIKLVAGNTHGFVAADLRSLCNQASLAAINKQTDFGEGNACITIENINECSKTVKPSAIKSILIDVPNVKWEDIGGQDDLKFKLKQAIEWPLKHPESFKRLGITPPKGILMYGPPGCSKTMIAKAIATESGLNFISVKGSELFSKWVGESEKAVQGIFRKARQVAPCVIFFDEIDSLGGERGTSSGSSNVHERVLAQILVEVDGIEALKDVTVVAATNRPDRIDQALLRPGRLDRIIYVPLPDATTRGEILKIRFRKMPVDPEVDIAELVKSTGGYSGAELTAVCHEAALKALEEDITSQKISQRHFSQALSIVKPRITTEQIEFYENYSINRKQP
ncbi:unnamed protein product [Orchesella dallaii]|uniref:AAA+ ATPase domain-containing protein n=1 Tax=Orchesella dallaii TaxID=48710 RepID=A0ABP1RFZ3_9HEXA